MANWLKVESVLAPFMGYLGAKQSGDPQLAQSRLSEMTKALDSLRQVQQMKMDREMSKYDAYSKMAMGVRDIGYGKRAEAEGRQIDATEARLRKATEQAVADGMMTPEYANMMLKNYEAETARDTYLSAKQAGTIPAQQYQKTQEALLGGKTAEQALIQEKPRYTTEADIAKAQATTKTAIPMSEADLLYKESQAEKEQIDVPLWEEYRRSQTAQNLRPSSSGFGDMMTAYQTESMLDRLQGRLGQFDSLKSRLLEQRKKVAMGNMDSGILASLGVNLQAQNEDPAIAKKEALTAIDQLIMDVDNNIKNTRKQYDRLLGMPEDTGGVAKPTITQPKDTPTYSRDVWDKMSEQMKRRILDATPNAMIANPDGSKVYAKNSGNVTPQATPTSTGNEIKSKPKPTTPTNKKTEKNYSEMSTDELYKGVGNSTKMK